MDLGASLPFDPFVHRLPDLLSLSIGAWAPDDPAFDLYAGEWSTDGNFLKLELAFAGVMNPPGTVRPEEFDPFRYGPNPVYGFVEIDMDADADTGGEIDAPEYRYLGNVLRFGGRPMDPVFDGRVAEGVDSFDGDFETSPFVERHGEEFHLVLLGDEFAPVDVTVMTGNGNDFFEAGEVWRIEGTFFHRAHGFEPFSFMKGGYSAGAYEPICHVEFRHFPPHDRTFVTLVFPLTNVGAGLMRNEPPETNNHNPSDHASVLEALEDLQLSALFLMGLPSGLPEQALIDGWANRTPSDHLDPTAWRLTALFGSSYTAPTPGGVALVWSDVYPNVVSGDVDGSGGVDGRDRQAIAQFITAHDASDGTADGMVTLSDFAEDFTVFDANYDGVVDVLDLAPNPASGDADGDGDVDILDVAILQNCSAGKGWNPACELLDFDQDSAVGLRDFAMLQIRMAGPNDPQFPR
jgi:hypothetical protein